MLCLFAIVYLLFTLYEECVPKLKIGSNLRWQDICQRILCSAIANHNNREIWLKSATIICVMEGKFLL